MLRGKYNGMRVRPSMDQIVGLIEHDPFKIRYPNRDASFIINSPYMLNMMGSSQIDLEEQSQRQKNYMMQQLHSKGIVDDAGDDDFKSAVSDRGMMSGPNSPGVGMLSPEEVQKQNMYARAKRGLIDYVQKQKQQTELYKVQKQEEDRLRNEELLRQQLEQLAKEEEDRKARAQQMMRSAIGSFPAHPFASSVASSSSGFNPANPSPIINPVGMPFVVTPQMIANLQQVQQGSLLVPRQGDIQIQYLQPGDQAAMTPSRTPTDLSMEVTPVQVKRTASPSIDAPQAKAKAKSDQPVQKFESTDYDDWKQLSKDQIYVQMRNFYGYTGTISDLDKEGLLTWLIEHNKIKKLLPTKSTSSSSSVKTKEKVLTSSKLVSRDYGHWSSLSKREIYDQLVNHYGRIPLTDVSYKQKRKDELLVEAVRLVGLIGGPTAAASSYKPTGRK